MLVGYEVIMVKFLFILLCLVCYEVVIWCDYYELMKFNVVMFFLLMVLVGMCLVMF